MKAVSFLALVLVHHLLQQLMQMILVLQQGLSQNGRFGSKATSKKPRKSMSHKKPQEKLLVNLLFFPGNTQWFQICYFVHAISQVWSSMTVVWSFPNKKLVFLSHFSLVQKEYKDFELLLLRQIYQRNHAVNYAPGNGLGTK